MPALTTGIFNIESARVRGDTWAQGSFAEFHSVLLRICCGDSRHDRKISTAIRWNHIRDQDVPQRSSSPERLPDIVAWEQSVGNEVPCRALQNTVKWFQLWTALAACFLILLM
jgi:hypothetical protein